MRIALITDCNPLARAAGTSAHPAYLARALARQGHRVTIYAREDGAAVARTAILGRGVSIERVQAGPARLLPAEEAARHTPQMAAYLADRWRAERPDVVHAFGWVSGLAALGAVRDLDIPVVQTFGSLGVAEHRHAGNGVPACRVKLETLIGRKAAVVLAGSCAEAADLARMGVCRPAIKVVPAGVDTDLFSPAGERAPSGRVIRLVATAPAGQVAGLPAVLHAIARVPGTELVIVGGPNAKHLPRTGPMRELAQLATDLRIRSRVKFAGEVGTADLARLLRSADLMVSAAPYEPTGTAAIQAMACGTPVIASAVGAHRDAVIDGTTGLLIAPEHPAMLIQRLRKLLSTPALLDAYGIAAADRARSRYSWERIGRETAAAYERCLPTAAPSDELAEDLAEAEGLEALAVSV
ncbi:MAG TPA: glycosyltransferase [Streptosporangiaceae bacterium]|nr:glycosyltransferase [Streptosporangiaceae bacterium]